MTNAAPMAKARRVRWLRSLPARARIGVQIARAFGATLPAGWQWLIARARILPADLKQLLTQQTLAQRLMEQTQHFHAPSPEAPGTNGSSPVTTETAEASAPQPEREERPKRTQRILLVRHGQTNFNIEGRLPGQIDGVTLTDEGRRQAHRAAVALAGLRLSAVVSSPLERARQTAEIIARGWALPVREDARLKDTDVGPWAGKKISDIAREDPNWKAFLEKPTEPPLGIESLAAVQERVVAVIEDLRADPTVGDDVVVVAHADVIKLIIARYTGVTVEGALYIVVGNASISALAFPEDRPPALLAVNWTSVPDWLVSPAAPPAPQISQPTGQSTEQPVEERATDQSAAEP